MSETPKRIQRKRTKGWRMPEGAVYVGRPSKWGNPFSAIPEPNWPRWAGPRPTVVETPDGALIHPPDSRLVIVGRAEAERSSRILAAAVAVQMFRERAHIPNPAELAGRDLACWCPLDQPCHADVLLEIANPTTTHAANTEATTKGETL